MPGLVKRRKSARRVRRDRRQQDIQREMLRRRAGELGKRPRTTAVTAAGPGSGSPDVHYLRGRRA